MAMHAAPTASLALTKGGFAAGISLAAPARHAEAVQLEAAPAPSAKGKWTKSALEAQAEEKAAYWEPTCRYNVSIV